MYLVPEDTKQTDQLVPSGIKGTPDFGTKHKERYGNWAKSLKGKRIPLEVKKRIYDYLTTDLYLTYLLRPNTCTVRGSMR